MYKCVKESKTLIICKYNIESNKYTYRLCKKLVKELYKKFGNVHYWAFVFIRDYKNVTYVSPHDTLQLNESLTKDVCWSNKMFDEGEIVKTKFNNTLEFYKSLISDKYENIYLCANEPYNNKIMNEIINEIEKDIFKYFKLTDIRKLVNL
jgi:hypothetical protein